jgi:hypothetical protein
LHAVSREMLGNLRLGADWTRAKLQGFAPGMWDPRKVVQNAK